MQKPSDPRKPVYHNVRIVEKSLPVLKPGEALVRINAAGFNHREVCAGCADYMDTNVMECDFYFVLALDSQRSISGNCIR